MSKALEKRRERIRYKLKQTNPNAAHRLTVFRSNKNIHAQVIDLANGTTVAAASTTDKELSGKVKIKSNIDAAKAVGEAVAKKAAKKKVESVIFDRSGYVYHGRIKALADAAREAGLKF